MIFAMSNHIHQIINGTKTQTRRATKRYQIGKTYAIQPCRTCKGISEGRIKIIKKEKEVRYDWISPLDALAEGGYSQIEFKELYEKTYPDWQIRWAYTFVFKKT